MILEVLEPLTVQRDGKLITLNPGDRLDWPEVQAEKLLTRAPEKVRLITGDWLAAWHNLAQATNNIERKDPRFQPVLDALEECDQAFDKGDWIQFREAAMAVHLIVKEGPRGGDAR